MTISPSYQDAIALCFDGKQKKQLFHAYQHSDSLFDNLSKANKYNIVGHYIKQLSDAHKLELLEQSDCLVTLVDMVADYYQATANLPTKQHYALTAMHSACCINVIAQSLMESINRDSDIIEHDLECYCENYLANLYQ